MKIQYVHLDTCHLASGAVVVIDVLRAFTTAAFAFEAGAAQILLTGTVDEAFDLRLRFPGALLAGEVNGLPIPGFDYGNSPSSLLDANLAGKVLIQRTSAGVQGVVRCREADHLFASSMVCARATVAALHRLNPTEVTFVVTGAWGPRDGDEDRACADYMAALLQGSDPDPAPYQRRVRESFSGQLFSDPDSQDFPAADLDCALKIDRFDFAMQVFYQEDLLVMRRIE